MFKKLLSLAAVALMSVMAAYAEPITLWESEEADGFLIGWGKPCVYWTPEQIAEFNIEPGDILSFTVAGVSSDSSWPQILLCTTEENWPGITGEGVGNMEYPYAAKFPVTYNIYDTIIKNGLVAQGDGAYVKSVELIKAEEPITENTVWFGEKKCDWGKAISVPASEFVNAQPGDQLKVWTSEGDCQIILGGWSGLNLPVYAAGSIDNMTYENGVATVTFIDEYTTTTDYVVDDKGKVEAKDVFALLKANGVVIHGPTIITRIDYVPATPTYVTTAHTRALDEEILEEYYGEVCFNVDENLKVEVYDGYFIIKAWDGVESDDLKVVYDNETGTVSEIKNFINGQLQNPNEDGYFLTSLEGMEWVYPYADYSLAATEDEDGYALLFFYINGKYNIYFMEWPLCGEQLEDWAILDECYSAIMAVKNGIVIEAEGGDDNQGGEIMPFKLAAEDGDTEVLFPGYAKANAETINALLETYGTLSVKVYNGLNAETGEYNGPSTESVQEFVQATIDLVTGQAEAYTAIELAYQTDKEDLKHFGDMAMKYMDYADENELDMDETYEAAAAIAVMCKTLSDAADAAHVEAINETAVYETPCTDEVMGELYDLVDEFVMLATAEYEEDLEFLQDMVWMPLNELMNGDEFPAFGEVYADDIADLIQDYYAASDMMEEAMMAFYENGYYVGLPAEVSAGLIGKVMDLVTKYNELLAAIENGYDADMDKIDVYASIVAPTIEDPDSDMAEYKAACNVEIKLEALREAVRLAQDTAIKETTIYVSPITDEDIAEVEKLIEEFKLSGIAAIATDAVEGSYFDINGRVVLNPTAGKVYIQVVNGKASKVLVK